MLNIINGPCTLSEYKYNEKSIYIFGEHHINKNKYKGPSISISDFISDQLSRNKDKFIDIYLELNYITGIVDEFTGELYEIRDKLLPYQNVIIHYSDVRTNRLELSLFSALITGLYHNLNRLRYNENLRSSIIVLLNELRKVLQSANEDNLLDFLIFQSDPEERIYEELDTCPFAIEILNFLNNKMREEGFTKTSLLLSLDNENYEQLAIDLIIWQSFILDVFILAQIFQHPQNVIIYSGNLHANKQRDFLNYLGAELINKYENVEGWIDVSSFKLPFFH